MFVVQAAVCNMFIALVFVSETAFNLNFAPVCIFKGSDRWQRAKTHFNIGQHVLDTNAEKQLSYTATDVLLTLVLKNWTTFKYRLEPWPPYV